MGYKISCASVSAFLILFITWMPLAKTCDNLTHDADSLKLHEKLAVAEQYYKEKKYDDSILLYQEIVLVHRNCGQAFHMLGKNYGRLAQGANWLKAIKYAKKTREAFEKAHHLNPSSKDIKNDLIEFYNEAPSFLGGDTKKANKLMAK